MDEQQPKIRGGIIKNIYLYLVSFVALMMIVFSSADLINIALKTYVFTKADDMGYYYGPSCPVKPVPGSTSTVDYGCLSAEEQKEHNEESRSAQRQNSVVRDLSMILVAVPVFAYHWSIIRKKEEV